MKKNSVVIRNKDLSRSHANNAPMLVKPNLSYRYILRERMHLLEWAIFQNSSKLQRLLKIERNFEFLFSYFQNNED